MSRPRICARQLTAGSGSCSYWWDTCPDNVRRCFIRFIRERTGKQHGGEIDMVAAKEWERARDKALNPAPKLDLERLSE